EAEVALVEGDAAGVADVGGVVEARGGEELVDAALLDAAAEDGVDAAGSLLPDEAEAGVEDGLGEDVAGAAAGGEAVLVGDELVGDQRGDDALHGAADAGGALGSGRGGDAVDD